MTPAKDAKNSEVRTVITNRKARHLYTIDDTWEAGISLRGTEVKSLRSGTGSLSDSYAEPVGNEIWIINLHIPPYEQGNRFNVDSTRRRKLLLNKREINRLRQAINREGMTLVPMKIYFNEKGRAKLELALAKGKKLHDKRETEKERDWNRQKTRLLKTGG